MPQVQFLKSLQSLKRQLLDLKAIKTILTYWILYGGRRALLTSPYLWLSIVFSLLLCPLWWPYSANSAAWADLALSILPNMLGFSMGGMAILLAFSDCIVFRTISESGKPNSFFMSTIANFFHIIFVQVLAIIVSFLDMAFHLLITSAVGFSLLMYSILLVVAIAGQLLHFGRVFNAAGSLLEGSKPRVQIRRCPKRHRLRRTA